MATAGDNLSIPDLIGVTTTPTRIDPAKGLGQRASITATFYDHPMSDMDTDKYVRERPYDSNAQGTFWGKFIARNPYYQGRPMRIRAGFLAPTFDWANFETRNYVLEQIDGPDSTYQVRVTGKDVLKLADDDRAVAPAANTGTLLADITIGDVTATLSPTGIGATEYPASGTLCIGSECMTFTRSGDVLTIVRGTNGTTASAHSAKDPVQLCLQYTGQTVDLVLYDLLVNYAKVPAAYIVQADWAAEVAVWMPAFTLDALIVAPEGVNKLVTELIQQALAYIWWDERAQKILFRAIRPAVYTDTIYSITDSNIVADTLNVATDPTQRMSEFWVYYGMKDPTGNVADTKNFSRLFINTDLSAESAQQYGDARINTVNSRWIPATAANNVLQLTGRVLSKFRDNPTIVTFELDAKDSSIWTGDVVLLQVAAILDETGAPASRYMQVVQVQEVENGTRYAYELADFFFQGRYCFIAPNGIPDYSQATIAQRNRYGFISKNDGTMSDGTAGYKII